MLKGKGFTPTTIRAVMGLALSVAVSLAAAVQPTLGAIVVVDSTLNEGARSTYIQGGFAYVSINSGLMVLDVTDPGNPVYVSRVDLPVPRPGHIQSQFRIAVSEGVAYVPMNGDGFYCVDISDPISPAVVGHVPTPHPVRELALHQGYLYAGGTDTGLMVYELSVPASPTRVSITPEKYLTVQDIAFLGNYAYVASFDVYVYDLVDLAHPVAVDTVTEAGRCGAVDVAGNMIYLADQAIPLTAMISGLGVLDASHPSAPVLVYSENAHADDVDVLVDGALAYLLNNALSEVHAMNVSNPLAPTAHIAFPVASFAGSMTLIRHGTYLYVSGTSAVVLYELDARGDFNGDGVLTSSDLILLANYVFKSGPPPDPPLEGDTDCVGGTTASDIIRLVEFVFKGGSAPACP